MKYGLAGNLSHVCTDIKTQHRLIFCLDNLLHPFKQRITRDQLLLVQREIIGNMAPGNNQCMKFCNRKGIQQRVGISIFGNNRCSIA